MSSITDLIKELRDKTGAGFLDCKKSLEENNNDIEKYNIENEFFISNLTNENEHKAYTFTSKYPNFEDLASIKNYWVNLYSNESILYDDVRIENNFNLKIASKNYDVIVFENLRNGDSYGTFIIFQEQNHVVSIGFRNLKNII